MKTDFACAVRLLFFSIVLLAIPVKGQETVGVFEQPLLITSAGQNAEVQIAAVLAKRAGLNYTLSKQATAADLPNMKTLVLVLGTSLKGLGAAGLDLDKERERVMSLITAAQKNQLPVVCLHLGGESRRGQQTDDLITEILPLAKMLIVVKSGNGDGFFTKICQSKGIPLIEVEKTADAQLPLQKAFK
ncbi:MAG: hypothetical protein A2Y86_06565 [Candidatus Aminicenantes bacterium RBG_13_62_12]|nr:MAG: hypothetical protein A2Y86_06565 [Candidatus Aminicenantes bacterium RBG_13_62_12]